MQYECTMYSGRAPAKKEKPCYTVTHLAENRGGERARRGAKKTKQNVLETVAHFGWTNIKWVIDPLQVTLANYIALRV